MLEKVLANKEEFRLTILFRHIANHQMVFM